VTGSACGPGEAASVLAAQADALLSAAAFLQQAGMTGLTIAVADDGITILVPRMLPPAARLAAVTALAAAVGAPAPVCTTIGTWTQVSATGTIGGHPARVSASIEPEDTAA
jgi:hypothetical protein